MNLKTFSKAKWEFGCCLREIDGDALTGASACATEEMVALCLGGSPIPLASHLFQNSSSQNFPAPHAVKRRHDDLQGVSSRKTFIFPYLRVPGGLGVRVFRPIFRGDFSMEGKNASLSGSSECGRVLDPSLKQEAEALSQGLRRFRLLPTLKPPRRARPHFVLLKPRSLSATTPVRSSRSPL